MGRWADIVTRVQNAVGDTTPTEAQTWVLESARELNAEARYYTTTVSLGSTSAGVGAYALPTGAVDLYSVLVNGEPYDLSTPATIERIDAALDYLSGGGVFADAFDSSGTPMISIRPLPSASGLPITGRAVLPIPAPVWSTGDPPFPVDFDKALRLGAISQGLEEKDERSDLAQTFLQRFEAEKARLRTRRHGRVGSGAIRLRQR